jgi:hypothetical protein
MGLSTFDQWGNYLNFPERCMKHLNNIGNPSPTKKKDTIIKSGAVCVK